MSDSKLEQMAREFREHLLETGLGVPGASAAHNRRFDFVLTALLTRAVEENKTHSTWTPEQIDSINAEMADGIINEIRGTLEELGCCHGHDMKSTPPMFYREAILCAMRKTQDKRDAELKRVVEEIRKEQDVEAWVCDEILRRMLDDRRSMTTSTASSVEEEGKAECDSA